MIVLCTGCNGTSAQQADLSKQSNKKTEVQTDGEKTAEDKQSNKETENQSEGEKTKMTAQQEEVFRSYGLTDEEIEKMKKEGLDYKEQSFADTAIMMLNYLEHKYSEKFTVVGGDIPGIFSHEYWITAEALDGEHAGEKFDVYYLGERGYKDGYITLLKQEEACEALKKLIQSKFRDVLIFPSLSGEYGDEIALADTGEEMLKKVEFGYNIIITSSVTSEEKFHEIADSIAKLLEDNGVSSSGGVRYLKGTIDPDLSVEDFNLLLENDSFQWNDYISTVR